MGGGSAHDNGNVNPATQIGTSHTHTLSLSLSHNIAAVVLHILY